MNDMLKNVVLWIVVAVVLMSMFNNFGGRKSADTGMSYSQFIAAVKEGQIKQVSIDETVIRGLTGTGERFTTYSPPNDPHMVDDLLENHVDIKVDPPESESYLMQIFISWFPMLLLIGVWVFFMRQRSIPARPMWAASLKSARPSWTVSTTTKRIP